MQYLNNGFRKCKDTDIQTHQDFRLSIEAQHELI